MQMCQLNMWMDDVDDARYISTLQFYSLDRPSDSILKLAMSSLPPSPSAPTPCSLVPMARERRWAWISSEMLSRLRSAARYSALATTSLA